MKTRLSLIDPELDANLLGFQPQRQRRAILRLIDLLLNRITLSNPLFVSCVEYLRTEQSIPVDLIEKLAHLVEELDEEYLSFQERYERGLISESELAEAFRVARAANAVLFAANVDPYIALAETIYEVKVALGDLEEIKRTVLVST